jgi:membrane-bound inhibitor of C-type lysozyme
MKQTAVEWLYDQLTSTWFDKVSGTDVLKKAKEMEKEQIKDAYKCGACDLEIQYSDVGEINSE